MKIRGKLHSKSGIKANGNPWILAVIFISLCLVLPQAGLAAWGDNPIVVAATEDDECRPQVVYDGSGGYYAVWQNKDSLTVSAKHYDAGGNATWGSPVVIGTNTYSSAGQESTNDGSGGLLVAWHDADDYTRVQRVLIDGSVVFAAGGVQVLASYDSWIAADGTGGAIVMSYEDGTVNRVAADGSLPWGDADNATSYSDNYSAPKIVPCSNGGAILVWLENGAVAVQRINNNGNFVWNGGNPVQVSADGTSNSCPRIIPQEDGGAIVSWYNSDNEVMANDISGDGQVAGEGGLIVYTAVSVGLVEPVSDGGEGAFIVWTELDNNTVYAQHVTTDGDLAWAAPVAMSSAEDLFEISYHPRHAVEDGLGGFVVGWENDSNQIIAQRCNSAGKVQWGETGALVFTAADELGYYGPKLVSNGQGGAVMVIVDYNDSIDTFTYGDILMQGVSASGAVGDPGYTPPTKSGGGGGGGCFITTISH